MRGMKNFLKSFALAVAFLVSGPLSDGIPAPLCGVSCQDDGR
jgi:hypothetical protein